MFLHKGELKTDYVARSVFQKQDLSLVSGTMVQDERRSKEVDTRTENTQGRK